MSTNNTSALFELIKSLSKSEKRYFKLFTTRHKDEEGNKSIELFDAIDSLKKDDNTELKRVLKDFSLIKNLRFNKHYLYKQILLSLELYHHKKDIDAEIRSCLFQVKILFKKGLNEQCDKLLAHVKKLARDCEKPLVLLEILQWENELMYEQPNTTGFKNYLHNNSVETINALEDYKNIYEYRLLTLQLHHHMFNRGVLRKKEDQEVFTKIIRHQLLKKEEKKISLINSRYYYHYCYSLYYYSQNNLIKSEYHTEKLVELIRSNANLTNEKTRQFATVLANSIMIKTRLKKYGLVPGYLDILKRLPRFEKGHDQSLFFAGYFQLWYYEKTGQFETGLTLLPPIEKIIQTDRTGLIDANDKRIMCFIISKIYFGTENYLIANFWMNKIHNDSFFTLDRQRRYGYYIFRLIITYELGKQDLLEYSVKSTYRFLLAQQTLYKVEQLVLDFIRQQPRKGTGKNDLTKAFRKLKTEMEKLTNDPLEKNAFEYFDFISWLDSKIENRPFADIVREKANVHIP